MTTVGTIELIARIDTSQYKRGASEIQKTNDNIESSSDSTSKKSSSSFSTLAKVGLGAVISAAVAAGAAIVSNIGSAVERIDTLNAFPKVLKTMGVSADEATKATNKIAKSLEGLPTSLQEGAKGVQSLVASGLNINRATDAYLAFNNALIAGNADAQDTQIVIDGLTRAISAGEVPASTLQAILSRMPTVMQALTKQTGKSQAELQKLYEKDPQKLIDDMIRLNKEGGGGLASLEKQARETSSGIGTSFDNMNNAITRGIGSIIKAIGSENISKLIVGIGEAFEGALDGVGKFIKDNKELVESFAVAIGIVGAAFIAASIGVGIFNAVLAVNPIVLIALAIAGLVTGLVLLEKNTQIFSKTWSKIQETIKPAIDFFTQDVWPILQQIGQLIGVVLKFAIEQLTQAWSSFMKTIEPFMPVLEFIGKVLLAVIVVAIGVVIASVLTLILVFAAFTAAILWVLNVIWQVGAGIVDFGSRVINYFIQAWEDAKRTVTEAWENIKRSITEGINRSVEFFRSLPKKILDALGNLGNLLFDAGKSILDGLARGIKSAADVPKKALEGVMDKLSDLLPHSPAKEGPFSGKGWTLYSGMSIVDALADGINKETTSAQNAMLATMNKVARTADYYTNYMSSKLQNDVKPISSETNSTAPQITQNFYPQNEIDMNIVNRKMTRELARS